MTAIGRCVVRGWDGTFGEDGAVGDGTFSGVVGEHSFELTSGNCSSRPTVALLGGFDMPRPRPRAADKLTLPLPRAVRLPRVDDVNVVELGVGEIPLPRPNADIIIPVAACGSLISDDASDDDEPRMALGPIIPLPLPLEKDMVFAVPRVIAIPMPLTCLCCGDDAGSSSSSSSSLLLSSLEKSLPSPGIAVSEHAQRFIRCHIHTRPHEEDQYAATTKECTSSEIQMGWLQDNEASLSCLVSSFAHSLIPA